MSAHELRMFNCNECDAVYKDGTSLRMHKNKVHRRITLPCSKCDKIFSDKRVLRKHMLQSHSIKCIFHKKRFLTNEEFNEHIQEEHVKKYCT